jgi:hypothetical protein
VEPPRSRSSGRPRRARRRRHRSRASRGDGPMAPRRRPGRRPLP